MSIFLLPKIIHNVCNNGTNEDDIYFKMTKEVPDMIVSYSLYNSLCSVKIQIEKNDLAWDNCKKITNPYEFIHTTIPGYKTQVSKMMPLSRSFYKMIEMSTIFNLCYNNCKSDPSCDTNGINSNENINYLLQDYIHNLTSNSLGNSLQDVKHIEWYTHDNYYYDAYSNSNSGMNCVNSKNSYKYNNEYKKCEGNDGGNVGSNSNQYLFRVVKNKNIFHEKENVVEVVENNVIINKNVKESIVENMVENMIENMVENIVQNGKKNMVEKSSENIDIDTAIINDATSHFKSFHLAEGPGGFIEAIAHLRKNKNDEYYGMTLISGDTKCPGWKKSKKFLEDNPNVMIEKGIDETGNLLSRDNFMHCYKKYKHKMNLVTGDGGIDFSEDFNNQEHTATKLVIAQVAYALMMQSNNGNFILKVFDTFSNATIDILYLLSSLYKHVYIMKPQTSRYANSERYIICKGYNLDENKERIEYIIKKLYDNFDHLNSKLYVETIFNFKCSRAFISKIEEINIIIGKKQIENITTTLNLMSNKNIDKIDYYKRKHMQKCIKWCEKYNIRFHKNIKTTNIFLTPTTQTSIPYSNLVSEST